MKKYLFIFLILGISIQTFAELKPKQIIGKWNYTVDREQGTLKGVFYISEKDGKLSGNIIGNENGDSYPFSKVEIQENETLLLEIGTGDDKITLTLKIEGKKFKGKGTSRNGEAPITGEKVE